MARAIVEGLESLSIIIPMVPTIPTVTAITIAATGFTFRYWDFQIAAIAPVTPRKRPMDSYKREVHASPLP